MRAVAAGTGVALLSELKGAGRTTVKKVEGRAGEGKHRTDPSLFHGKGWCRWGMRLPEAVLVILVFRCQSQNLRKRQELEEKFDLFFWVWVSFCIVLTAGLVILLAFLQIRPVIIFLKKSSLNLSLLW